MTSYKSSRHGSHPHVLEPHGLHRPFIEHRIHTINAGPHTGIDWPAAITALDIGDPRCSGSEQRILRLAANPADGMPVNLNDTLTGHDDRNIQLVTTAIRHASGQRL